MKVKKSLVAAALCTALCAGVSGAALARTVYYKGTGVYWNYGRNAGVFGFSDCNSQKYEHCSSVNGYSSGWQQPGTLSQAWGFVGPSTIQAYWNCRG
ncbi:hypothetical protein E5335_00900 [Coriobacteriaceae bacterium]|uniref:Lactococcin 972 family bacteriocin n=1 Tax=Granulimonas faecalis TaxID=2894155 RepID=A0AAV5B200_9ACTN|nr:hypothetical protein [Granulimonas faecalis]MBF0598535.1 hypothetical protein [Atopobiaceae bacterium FL090493]TGY60631.1 hypothetical protein E5335_00900 [Coriobacteriaceae bacterium]GJM55459.1 hypothetical protein ATOP_11140 [Granulimonas faecalis]